MEAKEKLINMLEKNPKLFKITNSKQHILVLTQVSKNSGNISSLKKYIHFKKDSILYNILENLISTGLIKKIKMNQEDIVYYITEDGKLFLDLYKEANEKYNI